MPTAFDLCLGACGVILTLAGTAIDFVVDRLTGFVLLQCFRSFLRSEIAAVPIDFFLVSGKKFRGHRNIMLVGSCHFYCMNQTAFLIYTNMGFIAEVPYIAFFCRVSLRVTFFLLVLGRGRSLDKRGIHNRATLQNQTALHQKFYYLRKQLLLDSVSHQNVAKSPQRITVRHLIAGFYSAKVRKGTAVDYLSNGCHI